MKFCSKCGKQIHDEAVICPGCGCAVEDKNVPYTEASEDTRDYGEKPTLANFASGFAFLMPIVGLILGIIGCVKYKTPKYQKKCIWAIPISILVWLATLIIFTLQ